MTGELWLTAAEAAALECVSAERIRVLAAEGRLTAKRGTSGRHGRAWLIALSSLSQPAQARYLSTHPELAPPPADDPHADAHTSPHPTTAGTPSQAYHTAPKPVRQRADLRLEAVLSWRRANADARHGALNDAEATLNRWLARFRAAHHEFKVSIASVKRWDRAYRASGLAGLVDGNDGHGRRGKLSIHPELDAAFRALWLRPTRPRIQDCYEQIRKIAEIQSLPVPSYSTFRRLAASVPEIAVRALRYEEDSSIRPFVARDYTSIGAMEIIQSDHHQADVAVRCQDDLCDRGHYPWTTVWFDVRSRKILGVDVYVDHPNSAKILTVFKRVVREHGLPGAVYLDNGLDYKKAFGWGVKYREAGRARAKWIAVDCAGVQLEHKLAPLGARVMFATPYNAQAKAIERLFRTLVDGIWRRFDSYRGALGQRSERAEYLRKHPEELPTLADFALALQIEIDEYNTTPHSGQGMDNQTPDAIFAESRIPRRDADPLTLSLVFFDEAVRTVDKGGVRFKNQLYRLDDVAVQARVFGEKIRVRFDGEDEPPTELVLTTLAGEFLGLAHPRELATYSTKDPETKSAIALKNRDWREIKALIREENPAAAKRLEKVASTLEEYERMHARQVAAAAAMPMAAAGGAGVVQMLPYESGLAKSIASARERVANPSGLSASDLELARSVEAPGAEELASLAREHRFAGALVPPARIPGRADDPDTTTAQVMDELVERRLQRLLVEREQNGMCQYDIECPSRAEVQTYCLTHWTEFHGR